MPCRRFRSAAPRRGYWPLAQRSRPSAAPVWMRFSPLLLTGEPGESAGECSVAKLLEGGDLAILQSHQIDHLGHGLVARGPVAFVRTRAREWTTARSPSAVRKRISCSTKSTEAIKPRTASRT